MHSRVSGSCSTPSPFGQVTLSHSGAGVGTSTTNTSFVQFVAIGYFLRLPFAILRATVFGSPFLVRAAVRPAFRRFCFLVLAIRTPQAFVFGEAVQAIPACLTEAGMTLDGHLADRHQNATTALVSVAGVAS